MMNQKLLETFTVDEINTTLHQIAALKAPGPDGFTACFYQQNWETVQLEVCNGVLHFLNSGHLDKKINATHIVLIPKTRNPISVTEF